MHAIGFDTLPCGYKLAQALTVEASSSSSLNMDVFLEINVGYFYPSKDENFSMVCLPKLATYM